MGSHRKASIKLAFFLKRGANEFLSKYDIIDGIAMNLEEIEEYCYLKNGTLSENRNGKIISMKEFRK